MVVFTLEKPHWGCIFRFCILIGLLQCKDEPTTIVNPLSYATEIIIEIKQFNPGRLAFNPFIASNRIYMVFPLRDTFTIENGLSG